MGKRRWFWVLLFIIVVILLGVLATGWNLVLVRDYQRIVEIGKSHSIQLPHVSVPWLSLILGSLGFLGTLGGLILLFVQLLQEMRLNQLQGEFLAAVSHELKTPIATLQLSASLLRDSGKDLPLTEPDREEMDKLWQSHDLELIRLREEVDTLLAAARWEAKGIELKKSWIDLEQWMEQSLPRWKRILGPEGVLRREGDLLHCLARADLKTLALITDNLVDNARKFSKGEPCLTIQTALLPSHGFWRKSRWQIRFKDEGWGFDPSESNKIFKRFVRVKTGAPQAIAGTGLGLYLAATASRAMKMSLRGQSPGPGQGAIFTLEGVATR